MPKFGSFLALCGINLLFIVALLAVVGILSAFRKPAYAVLKRNFLAYFTSPTGYVFLCLFVWLAAAAAFWTEDFFNANLANLDQLNRYLPLILMVFIPAITMSIWADERRQGTDELLLTIPATDFDIVLGKYLAAVAIYTVSLLFSELCNFLVLSSLGRPDAGLFVGNYLGYWLAGLAMLSIGMVASFLTSNLTVGFVLGVLLNVPLVAAGYSDVVFGSSMGRVLARWSISEQFGDFQAGVISLSSVLFFLMVAGAMFYVSMVLIGRRHWSGGRDGNSLGGHYLLRTVSLIVLIGAVCVLATRWDLVRADVTSERLNSLHPDTVALIRKLDPKYPPIRIDAYFSRDLPEEFVQRRVDLTNMLREMNALGGSKLKAVWHDVEPFSEEAAVAKANYGIDSQEIFTSVRGAESKKNVIFGFGVRSGLERVSVPFLGLGARPEYELVRAIVTVGETKRKRVGILTTDVQLFSAPSPMQEGNEEDNDQPLIQELRRQYQVVKVDPSQPITEHYDVLLAAQPSTLSPPAMKNFIDAVKNGQPTAIFEDPLPFIDGRVVGTAAPKRPPQGMPFMMQPPERKGDIQPLWDLLGLKITASEEVRRTPTGPQADAMIAWQDYNPHESDRDRLEMSREWVFITPSGKSAEPAFDRKSPVTSGLQELLLLYPGTITVTGGVNQTYTELIRTNRLGGTIAAQQMLKPDPFGGRPVLVTQSEAETLEKNPSATQMVLAVQVQRPAADKTNPPDKANPADGKAKAPAADKGLNVIVVADVDVLYGVFFYLRNMGDDPRNPIRKWNLDNVPLVLNIIDTLAGEDRFLNVRKRRPQHRELTTVSGLADEAKKKRRKAREEAAQRMEETLKEENTRFEKKIEELRKRPGLDEQTASQEVMIAITDGRQRMERRKAEEERKRDEKYREVDRELAGKVQSVQDNYKLMAVVLPPILPLLIALCVFIIRRSHEGEGASTERRV